MGEQVEAVREGGELGAARGVELGEEAGDVPFDGAVADEQPGADLAVGEALRDEAEHLALAWREVERVLSVGDARTW